MNKKPADLLKGKVIYLLALVVLVQFIKDYID